MSAATETLMTRMGRGLRAGAPSFLVIGDSRDAFEAIAPLLDRLEEGKTRAGCFLSAADPALRSWLEERFSGFVVVPPPFGFGPASAAYLRRLKIRTVLLLERESILTPQYAQSLARRAIPLVLLSGRGVAHLEPAARRGYAPELLVTTGSPEVKPQTADARLRVFASESGRLDDAISAEVLELLMPLAGRNVKWVNRGDRRLRRWFGRRLFNALENPTFAARLKSRVRRFDSLDALRRELKEPETVLCLGNGPSSEDPALEGMEYDALFRVNHSWMERDAFTDADVVFTGGQSTMKRVTSSLLGLQDESGEKALLKTRGPGMLRSPFRYFVMDRLGPYLTEFDWGPHRPTNGAAMIAMAVALEPRRLIIAGVDLFRHPEGSYPGDKNTPNAYTPAHTMAKELAFMFHHLDRFEGELVIVGEALSQEWREHLSG